MTILAAAVTQDPQFNRRYPAGTCEGCRIQAALRRGHCRLCHCQAQYLAGSSPWDTGPLHFRELGPGGHQLFFASMIAVSWNHGRKGPGLSAAPVPPGPGATARPEAVPRQPELFTLPFEMTPWRILDGDWPRPSWYEHLLPAVARAGQLRGWSLSVQEHVRNTLRSLIATQPADARTYPPARWSGSGQTPATARPGPSSCSPTCSCWPRTAPTPAISGQPSAWQGSRTASPGTSSPGWTTCATATAATARRRPAPGGPTARRSCRPCWPGRKTTTRCARSPATTSSRP